MFYFIFIKYFLGSKLSHTYTYDRLAAEQTLSGF